MSKPHLARLAGTVFLIGMVLFWLFLFWLDFTMTAIFTALTIGAIVGLIWLMDTQESWKKLDQGSGSPSGSTPA